MTKGTFYLRQKLTPSLFLQLAKDASYRDIFYRYSFGPPSLSNYPPQGFYGTTGGSLKKFLRIGIMKRTALFKGLLAPFTIFL